MPELRYAAALTFFLMAFQSASVDWTLDGQLHVGASKQDFQRLAEKLGGVSACSAPSNLEMPVGNVEVCKWSASARTISALIARDHTGAQRVVAYAVRGASSAYRDLRDSLTEKLGQPASRSNGRWGENTTWRMGASWTVLHSTCALQSSCLEVSQDMTARRLARSAGVFMPTYQPV